MTGLVGHGGAVAALREAAGAGRLHHAWLVTGPPGIGKARFACDAARWLLARATPGFADRGGFHVDEDRPTAALLRAGSHPDFSLLQRLSKERSEDRARSITIDQVRALQAGLAMTPSLSERRIVVIDSIDDLERGAANALLKSLEEPPAGTAFLLVSHAPGRLLPTIRSRCRVLRLERLADAEVATVLNAALADSSEAEIRSLTALAAGSPGTAIRFAGLDVAGIDSALERLVRHGDPGNALRSALARTLSGKAAQPRYEVFLERAPSRIAEAARIGGDPATIRLWEAARRIADGAVRLSLDPQLTVFEIAGLVAQLAPTA